MLLVQFNGTLGSLIADNIAMGQVLSNDAGSWLLLLGDLITVALCLGGKMASVILLRASGAGNLDVGRTELSVVEEESSLGRGFLFEGNSRFMGLGGGLDLDAGNLAAVCRISNQSFKKLDRCEHTRRRRSP